MLSALGRREEALAATSDAVEVRRRLAEALPEVFGPDLVRSLASLACLLEESGREEESRSALEEATELARRLGSGE